MIGGINMSQIFPLVLYYYICKKELKILYLIAIEKVKYNEIILTDWYIYKRII